MRTQPQPSRDFTLAAATAHGFNVVQPKFVGQWGRCIVSAGKATVYGFQNTEVKFFPAAENLQYTLIGNLLHDGTFVIFDCWSALYQNQLVDLTPHSYRERFGLARIAADELDAFPFDIVLNVPLIKAADLWQSLDARHCGLVYRKTTDDANAVVGVARKYANMPGGVP